MKHVLKKMAAVANELDINGFEKEANEVTMSMLKMAQVRMPQPSPDSRSPYQQANQPVTVQAVDFVADNTGKNVLIAGGENVAEGAARGFRGLMDFFSGVGQVTIGAVMDLFGYTTLPVEAVAEIYSQLGHDTTDPLLGTIETQDKAIRALLQALQEARRKGDKAEEERIKAQGVQAAEMGAKAATQLSNMLKQRKAAGQYELDAPEFQKTLDYSVANKLTLRDMYDQAVRNRGGGNDALNFANNLVAKYRSIHGNVPDTALVVTTKLS